MNEILNLKVDTFKWVKRFVPHWWEYGNGTSLYMILQIERLRCIEGKAPSRARAGGVRILDRLITGPLNLCARTRMQPRGRPKSSNEFLEKLSRIFFQFRFAKSVGPPFSHIDYSLSNPLGASTI